MAELAHRLQVERIVASAFVLAYDVMHELGPLPPAALAYRVALQVSIPGLSPSGIIAALGRVATLAILALPLLGLVLVTEAPALAPD
ncbi:MAG TPA: hypothetical protein VM366_06570 [Anaerolineae bacterium]|nr:hypothetical protein [Anaerolineae bacterium]